MEIIIVVTMIIFYSNYDFAKAIRGLMLFLSAFLTAYIDTAILLTSSSSGDVKWYDAHLSSGLLLLISV